MAKIIIEVKGGMIVGVLRDAGAQGIKIEVHDYDIEAAPASRLRHDDDGNEYLHEEW